MRTVMTALFVAGLLSHSAPSVSAMNHKTVDTFSALPADTRCAVSAGTKVVDYGTQSRWQLQEVESGNNVTPGKRTLMISVICPYSQTMRLALRGERAANGDLRYGDSGSVNIRLLDAQLDDHNVQVATTTTAGVMTRTTDSSTLLQPGNILAAMQNGNFATGKRFNLRVEIEPILSERAARVSRRQVSESTLVLDLLN